MSTEYPVAGWDVTIREVGEVDSVESVQDMLDDLAQGMLTAGDSGTKAFIDGVKAGTVAVPEATHAGSADSATYAATAGFASSAGSANTAVALSPGTTINGVPFDGSTPIAIGPESINGVPRFYYGTVAPESYTFEPQPNEGDIYIRIL